MYLTGVGVVVGVATGFGLEPILFRGPLLLPRGKSRVRDFRSSFSDVITERERGRGRGREGGRRGGRERESHWTGEPL